MDVKKVHNELTKEKWRSIVQDRKNYDMSNREYCHYLGVSEATFYHWQQYFRQEECDHALEAGIITADAKFVPIAIPEDKSQLITTNESAIKIQVGDATLSITNDISDDLLQKIWRLMKC